MPSILAMALLTAALTAAPTAAVSPARTDYRAVDLGTLGGDSSYATAMNDRGDVVGRAQDAAGIYHGFLWRNGRMINLGDLVLHDLSLAGVSTGGEVVDLNDRGRIAASIRPVWGMSRAVVYHPR